MNLLTIHMQAVCMEVEAERVLKGKCHMMFPAMTVQEATSVKTVGYRGIIARLVLQNAMQEEEE